MYPKLSSNRFTWTTEWTNQSVVLTLCDNIHNRTKVFKVAKVDKQSLTNHMNTLTDELCEAFWPKERVKKQKKVVME